MKTTILIPYLGRRPRGFEHFALSASHVPGAVFLYLTDDAIQEQQLYPNFRILPFSLADFNRRSSAAIGCEIRSGHSMKICDFRPAFGLIFGDLLAGSDFWGYCDSDVLFGDMSPYLASSFLSRFDVVSMNANYLSGSFTLWRNESQVNRLFERSPQWRELMTSPDLRAFDECGHGLWEQLNSGVSIFDVKSEFLSMTHVVRILERDQQIRAHFQMRVKEVFEEGEVLRWTPGRVVSLQPVSGVEHAYFHSVLLKQRREFRMPDWNPLPSEIYVSRSGYHRTLAGAVSTSERLKRLSQHHVERVTGKVSKAVRMLRSLTSRP